MSQNKDQANNIFYEPQLVLYWAEKDNVLIYTPPTIFMFATIEGSTPRKLCVSTSELDKYVILGEL